MDPLTSNIRRFLAISSIALALPMAAIADPGFGGPIDHGAGMMHRHGLHHAEPGLMPMLRHLDLSEAQQDKVFAIMHAQAPQMREHGKALHKARTELRDLALSDKFDDARARALADTAARAQSEMALLRARTVQQIFALLTPEQRKQALELKARFDERRMGMGPGDDFPHGPGMGRGPGGPADRRGPPAMRGDL